MLITAKSHPAVFAAILEIDYDNGAVNRLEPEQSSCEVPPPFDSLLDESEKWLATLSVGDLHEFCCGEQLQEHFNGDSDSKTPNELLNAYFEGWPETEKHDV